MMRAAIDGLCLTTAREIMMRAALDGLCLTRAHTHRGILGVGAVCEVKSGPAFYRVPGSRLVAVMRRDAALCQSFAERHQVPRWYTSAEQLVEDPEVDAVYVATPPETHKELALLCCAAGKPCLVEKPMARSSRECAEMIEAFRQRELPLFVAYYRRHLPKFQAVRDILESGELGDITEVELNCARPAAPASSSSNWRIDARVAGGGLFLDLGSHMMDLVDWLLGPLADMKGVATRLARDADGGARSDDAAPSLTEDNVRHVFRTQSGALGMGSWNFVSSLSEDRVRIVGRRGHLTFSVFDNAPVFVSTHASGEREVGGFEEATPAHVHQPLVAAVVRDLQRFVGENEGRWTPADEARAHCRSTAVSAVRASEAMDEVLRDYYGGSRDDAFWERPGTWRSRGP